MNLRDFVGRIIDPISHLFSRDHVQKAMGIFTEVNNHIPAALIVVREIEQLVPRNSTGGRDLAAIEALATKYELHMSPEIIKDPVQLQTVIQNAAFKELKEQIPTAPDSILRTALSMAVNLMKSLAS